MASDFCKIILTDVYYGESQVSAAGLLIDKWEASTACQEFLYRAGQAEQYVPGEFYLRELPPLLQLLSPIPSFDCVVVDAHVWLQKDRPGCGYYLWKSLNKKVPVIGVAKNAFHLGIAKPLFRGTSRKPLYVSSVGIEVETAVAHIAQMHGSYRIPTLLKQVDHLSRK